MKHRVLEALLESQAGTKEPNASHTSSILDLIVEEKSSEATSMAGVVIGKLEGFDDVGRPLVSFVCNVQYEHLLARTAVILKEEHVGADVVLAFEHGDPRKPIIMGSLWQLKDSSRQKPVVAELDGERLTLTAERQIILRCGKASITLTQAGKVLIQGAYVLSRSSGANKIKGGSIDLN